MPAEPQIHRLSHARRTLLFWTLVLIFALALPSLIFYTTGHRLAFSDAERTIVTTGGLYVSTMSREAEVYLDEQPVQHPRLFRSAFYIQNVNAGVHRLVVQEAGAHTWVKELPVDPYLVTEAAAFNVPRVPQVRPITPYVTADRTPVVVATATTSDPLSGVTTTVPYRVATSSATTTLLVNEEYAFVESLFGSTSTSTGGVVDRLVSEFDRFRFASATTSPAASGSVPRRVVERGNIVLYQRGPEVVARYTGSADRIPYYFCVSSSTPTVVAARYGEHVAEQIATLQASSTRELLTVGTRLCRTEIRLDRKRQDVEFFHFVPGSSDLVLLQLTDGLYVVEIDDRAWQNVQPLYPGTDLTVVVESSSIYVRDGTRYFEVYPTPQDR